MIPDDELESTVVRHCERCGELDLREQWETLALAVVSGVEATAWTCETCRGHRFQLVERFPGGMHAYPPRR
jgi:hypothetical protein